MIIADTNLLVYLYLPGERTDAAERVLQRDAEWAAPVLWRSEFRNVLAYYVRRQSLAVDTAVAALHRAEATVQGREYAVETRTVLGLVRGSSCSAYDCEFVALARDLGVPLVTSDGRVLREFAREAVSMHDFAA